MKPNLLPEVLEMAERQAALCRIFGNPQRILILWLLAEKELTVTEIAAAVGGSMQRASQHLHLMSFSNRAESRRERHNIYYHIADHALLKNCLVLANKPEGCLVES